MFSQRVKTADKKAVKQSLNGGDKKLINNRAKTETANKLLSLNLQRNPNKKKDYAIFLTHAVSFFDFHSLRERVKKQEQIYVYCDNIL